MLEKPKPTEPEVVACRVCLEEIPKTAANSQEADAYAQHFCGLECYSKWKQQHESESDEDS